MAPKRVPLWCSEITDNGQGAKLPKHPTNIAFKRVKGHVDQWLGVATTQG
jgi:hypothetical protein